MSYLLRSFLYLSLVFSLLSYTSLFSQEDDGFVALPKVTQHVTDTASILNAKERQQIAAILQDIEKKTGAQVIVVTVPSTQPEAIEQYSIRLVDQVKAGRKGVDDGALLLIAFKDKKIRIEVGYGLEGSLTDIRSKQIIDHVITPAFKRGLYGVGIHDAVIAMAKIIDPEGKYQNSKSSQNLRTPLGSRRRGKQMSKRDTGVLGSLFLLIIFALILKSLFGKPLARGLVIVLSFVIGIFLFKSFFIGVLLAVLSSVFGFSPVLLTALLFAGTRGGGFGGGGFGGGGFGGGGGGFGGGGASGGW